MIKQNINDLAILGGNPVFNELLHVGRPNIGNQKNFLKRVDKIFKNRWLTNDGPFLQELEQKLSQYLGVKYCIVICNATIALEIAARALGLTGEVIVPSFTFIATAHALQWQGITPIFCDIDPITHNIDASQVEKLITPNTTGILGVHVWGRACDVELLDSIAKKHKLKLLFDAAHAFSCTYQNKMIGSFGDVEVFSFHATKFFNSFEGGAITTNDYTVAQKVRSMRNFGFAEVDTVVSLGTNGKMSEISAAMGLTSLESLNEFIEINQRNYLNYSKNLESIPGLQIIKFDEKEKNNYQYVVLEVDENVMGISRDSLATILQAENIFARRYFYPGCHQMSPYWSINSLSLPETEKLTSKVLQLPTGTAIGENEIRLICELIHFVFAHHLQIKKSLG